MASENEEFEFRARAEQEKKTTPEQPHEDVVTKILNLANQMTPQSLALKGMQKGFEGYDEATKKAGELTSEAASALGASPELAGVAGAGVYTAGQMVGGAGLGSSAKPALEKFAEKSMSSALHPSATDVLSGDAAKAIKTMLDENINVTKSGIEKLQSKITELNNEIKDKIASSDAVVDKNKLSRYMDDLTNRFLNQVNPRADIKAIKDAWNEFVNHPLLQSINEIPVQTAQKLKQGTYQQLSDKAYGEIGTASTEAQKTLARGLKEQIAEQVPAVAQLNKKESELLNALTIAEKKALLDVAKDPAMLAAMHHSPQFIAAESLGKSAAFKSTLANIVYRNSKLIPSSVGAGSGYIKSQNQE